MRQIVISVLAAAALGGCADLPPIAENECGNSVVEPGEDCDGNQGDCRPAGSVGQCHFDCSLLGDGTRRTCPAGWACGGDDVCRQGSGRFSAGSPLYVADLTWVTSGDFDGDQLTDLLTGTIRGVEAHYSIGDSFAQSTPLPPSIADPAVGSMTTDPRFDDVITADPLGIMVSRGRPDRTMQPTVYSPYPLPPNAKASVVLASGMGHLMEDNGDGLSMVMLVESQLWPVDGKSPFMLGDIGVAAGDLASDIVAGQLVEDPVESPCDEIVYVARGAGVLHVLELCTWDGAEPRWNFDDGGQPVHALPPVSFESFGSEQPLRVLLIDYNGDGHLDLLVSDEANFTTSVAFGLGDGRFHSNAAELGSVTPDQTANLMAVEITGEFPTFGPMSPVVAAGDLNGDSYLDFVVHDGVLVSAPPPPPEPPPSFDTVQYQQAYLARDLLAEASVVDLNQNDLPDVVALEANGQDMVFLNGAGAGLFNEFRIPLGAQASDHVVGDFDGDLLLDVAFRKAEVAGDSPGDTLAITFGQAYGAPSSPLSMGKLENIDQILAAALSYDPVDAISDLIVLSHHETVATLAVLIGTSSRQMLSPFVLADGEGDATDEQTPVAVVSGEFDGVPEHRDLAAIGLPNNPSWASDIGVWLLPSSGDAAISAADVSNTPVTVTTGVGSPLLAAVDLDGDGIDELVGLYGVWTDFLPEGRLLTAKSEVQEGKRAWVVATSAQKLTESYGGGFDGPGVGGLPPDPAEGPDETTVFVPYRGHVEVGDVTGDGLDDVVALSQSYDDSGGYWTAVVVFPSDGSGQLDVEGRIVLDHELTGSHTGFTITNIDGDPDLELVLLAVGAVYVVDVARPASEWPRLFEVSKGLSLAAGDFDHDGVEDLAVGQPAGVATFFGQARLP